MQEKESSPSGKESGGYFFFINNLCIVQEYRELAFYHSLSHHWLNVACVLTFRTAPWFSISYTKLFFSLHFLVIMEKDSTFEECIEKKVLLWCIGGKGQARR